MLQFNGVPVPYTASWTGEDEMFVGFCEYAQNQAICQKRAQGVGRPRFAKPHFVRQREVIVNMRCDLCGLPLTHCTKISLSHARVRDNSALGADVLQVEPLLHAKCAALCIRHCPSLKRDLANGTFEAHIVTRSRVQLAVANPEFIGEYVPGYKSAPGAPPVIAHAKVWIIKAARIDVKRLERAA